MTTSSNQKILKMNENQRKILFMLIGIVHDWLRTLTKWYDSENHKYDH